jgi:hypothetical protein
MKRLLATLALSLACAAAPVAAPAPSPKPRPGKGGPLGCEINADATCEVGKAPRVTVKLINRTRGEVMLIGSLDGSDYKMRYPHAYFEVIGPDGKSAVKRLGRCGNTNPLTAKNIVKVPAGGSFNPYAPVQGHGFFGSTQLSGHNFDRPGKYRIRFVYSTEAPDDRHFGARPLSDRPMPAGLVRLLKRVPRTTVTSNEVVVEVSKK